VSDKLTIEDDIGKSGNTLILLFGPEEAIVCIDFLLIRDDSSR